METAYLHLVTNHIPIMGVPFALALLVIGLWRRSDEIKAVSFLVFALLGVLTTVVYLLGQGGEDFVEDLAGVSHDLIEDHEDIAKIALASTLILAGMSAFAILRYRGLTLLKPRIGTRDTVDSRDGNVFPTWAVIAVLALALLTSGILGYTGRLGGKIRHPEFHDGAAVQEQEDDENGGGRRKRGRR
jgi:hypothetical protein